MTVFDLEAILRLDKSLYEQGLQESETQAESAGSKIGKALGTLGKVVAGAAAAGAAAVGKLTLDAVSSYGNYEQLIGGVETLFKDSADLVSEYADIAYKTAQISANEYMETVTSFSASLLQSLDGDTEAAAKKADMAIIDMSDNASKMGTSLEAISVAYSGFAKQNYTMLDNLKLGYGGTKTEMERLIKDAEKLDDSFRATRDANGDLAMSYSDIIDAIHIVQTEMGITGTTAREAASTIEGSVNSMKASWKNLVTGLANNDRDVSSLVDDFVVSLETAVDNIMPAVETALSNLGEALPRLAKTILPRFTDLINTMLPSLVEAVSGIIASLADALPSMINGLIKVLPNVIQTVFENIGTIAGQLLPSLAEALGTVLLNLPSLLIGAVSGIVKGIGNLFTGIAEAVDNAISPQFTEGAFANTVAGMQTNAQSAFSKAVNNIKKTWATVIGNTDWSEALNDLSLAEDALQAIYDDYKTFKDTLDTWSPEAAKVDFEIKSGTVTSLITQISDLVDENGHAINMVNGSLLETIAGQVNELLGEEVLTVEKSTGIQAVIDRLSASFEEGVEDPVAYVTKWIEDNTTLDDGIPYTTLAELSLMYGSLENPPEDVETWIRDTIKNDTTGKYSMWNDATIDVVCDLIASDGDVKDAWFAPEEGKTISDVIKEKYDLDQDIDIPMLVQFILEESEQGVSADDITSILDNYFGTDIDWNKIVDITVNGVDDINEAIKSMQQLTIQTYAQASAQGSMDYYMSAKEKWGSELEAWSETYTEYVNATDEATKTTLYSTLQTLYDSLTGLSGTSQEAVDAYLVAMYNLEQTDVSKMVTDINEVPQAFKETWSGMAQDMMSFTSDYSGVEEEWAGITQKAIQDSRTLGNTTIEQAGNVKLAAQELINNAKSWGDISGSLGDAYGDVNLLQAKVVEYMQSEASAMGTSEANLLGWLQSIYGVQTYIPEFGMTIYELADVLSWLSSNEALVTTATDEIAESTGEASGNVDEFSEHVRLSGQVMEGVSENAGEYGYAISHDYGEGISSGEKDVSDAADTVAGAAEDPFKALMEQGKYFGQVLSTNVSGSILEEKDGMKEAAQAGLVDPITESVEDVPDDMKETGSDSGSKLQQGLRSQFTMVKIAIQSLAGFFNSEMQGVAQVMENFGLVSGQKLADSLITKSATVRTAAGGLASSIVTPFNGLYNVMYNAGSNAGLGLYNGLNGWSSAISNMAYNIAQSVNIAAKEALKIKSPSQVLRETFGYVGEGMYLGLADKEDLILGEANYIVDSIGEIFEDGAHDIAMNEFTDVTGAMEDSISITDTRQDKVYNLLLQYLPVLANMGVYIDGKELVGHTFTEINKRMGEAQVEVERGGAVYA